MARQLFTVEDTFFIQGRGLILLPGIVPVANERFRVGDRILLKRPDGSSLAWKIGGIEMLYPPPPGNGLAILLTDLAKDDVPIESEVWSIDSEQ